MPAASRSCFVILAALKARLKCCLKRWQSWCKHSLLATKIGVMLLLLPSFLGSCCSFLFYSFCCFWCWSYFFGELFLILITFSFRISGWGTVPFLLHSKQKHMHTNSIFWLKIITIKQKHLHKENEVQKKQL